MKACPSIAVSSPASLETLYFPFNYSPCSLPLLPHPHGSSWLPTASRPADVAPSPSVLLVFFFLCLRCTKAAGGGRGEGQGEAMESWMVGGRRDSPLPRLQLWSGGGGDGALQRDPHCLLLGPHISAGSAAWIDWGWGLSLIHISEPTRPY